jgi:hypothetical protein
MIKVKREGGQTRLRGVIEHRSNNDPGFFVDLSTDGILDGFSRLGETCQTRVHALWPGALTTEEDTVAIFGDDTPTNITGRERGQSGNG